MKTATVTLQRHIRLFGTLHRSGRYAPAVSTPNRSLQRRRVHTITCHELRHIMPPPTAPISAPLAPSVSQRSGLGTRPLSSWASHIGKQTEPTQGETAPAPITTSTTQPGGLGNRLESSWTTVHKPKQGDAKQQDSHLPGTRYESSTAREYEPRTKSKEAHVYVLTLRTSESISEPMTAMREQYFPKHLNRTPAHLTMFHALPHSKIEHIQADLDAISSCTKPFLVSTGRPFRMKRGVGIGLHCGVKESQALQLGLQENWGEYLSDQDRSRWIPHWTVMNKVDDEKMVRDAFDTIRRDLLENEQEGRAVGLDLWLYDKGDWVWKHNFKLDG